MRSTLSFKALSIMSLLVAGYLSSLNAENTSQTNQSFNKKESSLQIEPDGTKLIKDADGTSVQVYPDGTKIIKKTDGTLVKIHPDGSKTITEADGTTIQIKPGN